MRRLSGRSLFVGMVVTAAALLSGYFTVFDGDVGEGHPPEFDRPLKNIPFNGREAYEYLKKLCEIGPRPSGSPGMVAQQKLLAEHFSRLGGRVSIQQFRARNPLDGSAVPMANLIVEWHPNRPERILLCAHYDTRPFPDRDKNNPKGKFIGANDGASGVAVLMELAKSLPKLDSRYGVDFALFDGEEFVFRDPEPNYPGDPYSLGSEWFARQYVGLQPRLQIHYKWGVLLDMVGSKDLKIHEEGNSVGWDDTRPLVEQIWGVARELHVNEFVPRKRYDVHDDHLHLHDIGGIPTCDVIDFDDEPYWHTERDTPDHCSALSLAKVGWVIEEWLKKVQ